MSQKFTEYERQQKISECKRHQHTHISVLAEPENSTTTSNPQSFLSILETTCHEKLEKEREQKRKEAENRAFKEVATLGFAKNMVEIIKKELLEVPLEDIRNKNGSVEIGHDRAGWATIISDTTFNYKGVDYKYNPNDRSKFPDIFFIILKARELANEEGINYRDDDVEAWASKREIFYVQLPNNFPIE